MKVTLSWLQEFVEVDLSPEEIADALTMGGLEVEKIERVDGEVVFDISLTPNLGHCMSVLGVARELSALKSLPLKQPKFSLQEDASEQIKEMLSVDIQDQQKCWRYACRLILNVQIGPSPHWLTKRLEAVGIRSINNVVDVTNYVMLEYGQPLHAFDYDKITGKKIFVTSVTNSSSMVALDEKVYDIPEDTLLIADVEKPLAFAGVMGGKESSVTETTQHVLIESAYFTSQAIRKTSKLLQLRTESSQRFEKEIDFDRVALVLDRAAGLIQEITRGKIVKGAVDRIVHSPAHRSISCRIQRINHLLGTHLSLREVVIIFEKLQLKIQREDQDVVHVLIPGFRNDLKTEIDLIEEISRIYGYQNIPLQRPKYICSSLDSSPIFLLENELRSQLVGAGFQECITCDLISPFLAEQTAEASDPRSWISVIQPASVDQSLLRTSLLPGLLQMVQTNQAHQIRNISAFEIGRIHFKEGEQCKEETMIGIIRTGLSSPYYHNPKSRVVDFFDIKGDVCNIFFNFGITEIDFEPSHLHNFHPGRQARIKHGKMTLGTLGEIHPARLQPFSIDDRVYFAQIDLHSLLHLRRTTWKIKDLLLFPGSERDWTLTIQEEISLEHILSAMPPSSFLEKVLLLDIYRGPQLKPGQKNVTLRFFYRGQTSTLSFEAVEEEHRKVVQAVAKNLEHLLH